MMYRMTVQDGSVLTQTHDDQFGFTVRFQTVCASKLTVGRQHGVDGVNTVTVTNGRASDLTVPDVRPMGSQIHATVAGELMSPVRVAG